MFAIVDCNNFYVSCERVFNSKLVNKPVIVLSNNDGCVIARSDEAKALNIKMGQPFFEIKHLCQKKGIDVFSSNYALYGDMSNRIMVILESLWPDIEIYSIDEAFLNLKKLNKNSVDEFCEMLQKTIKQYTGIPVSIGIGPSKTLAKLANHIAKRELKQPTFNILHNMSWLKTINIDKIWGIGSRWTKKLNQLNIKTAYDLSLTSPNFMRKKFNVALARTVLELQQHACLKLEEVAPKKQIMSSQSFAIPQTDMAAISQALSSYCAKASEKLRKQHSVAKRIDVFIRTNPFRKDLPQYNASVGVSLVIPTSDVRIITYWAKACLKQIFKTGYLYKKAGISLHEITPSAVLQSDLFNPEAKEQANQLMKILDEINKKYGRGTIKLAAEGTPQQNRIQSHHCSPCYTTRWSDLPIVYL